MNNRQETQKAQERFYVCSFLKWFNNAHRANFRVISEPNPPEAIIQSSRSTRWVEIGAAYWNEEYAKDLNSYATSGEAYAPMVKGPYNNMDSEFAQRFVSTVK